MNSKLLCYYYYYYYYYYKKNGRRVELKGEGLAFDNKSQSMGDVTRLLGKMPMISPRTKRLDGGGESLQHLTA